MLFLIAFQHFSASAMSGAELHFCLHISSEPSAKTSLKRLTNLQHKFIIILKQCKWSFSHLKGASDGPDFIDLLQKKA